MDKPIKSLKKDLLNVEIFENGKSMGVAAADFVAKNLQQAIQQRGVANLILATGASQFLFIEALKKKEIRWDKVTVFHLDEYKGISDQHPASFRKYLKERILDIVKPGKVYLINGDAENLDREIEAYEELLKTHPIDVACIGIGENGHIAFNDPPVANFNDPRLVKVVELDHACRLQQLGEGWFPTLADVPKEAVSLTVTAIMNCKTICCVVPDKRKAKAVHNTLHAEISTMCPATILRRHPDAVLFIDMPAASEIL
ncbi:MAG: glucosamine-6-phosphate deaminase [Prolixibacteraceae bacterium]|jgi:glucosamine-6-phosphate deaminase|nr:glucosamine-6-phosphate deaminase [Prolixibacteraceae bacterium]